jgi:hypothetical protein
VEYPNQLLEQRSVIMGLLVRRVHQQPNHGHDQKQEQRDSYGKMLKPVSP